MDTEDRKDRRRTQEDLVQATSGRSPDGRDQEDGPAVQKAPRKIRRMKVAAGERSPAEAQSQRPGPACDDSDDGPRNFMRFLHFDAQTGKVAYIDKDGGLSAAACECPKCGTAMQPEAERCPVCGTEIGGVCPGIVALLDNEEPGWHCPKEMDCPQCGEHVRLVGGACPECGASMTASDEASREERPGRLVDADNVFYVHLDVESGELEYLQRLEKSQGFEHTALRVKDADSNGSAGG